MNFLSLEFAILLLLFISCLPRERRIAKLITLIASVVFYAFAGIALVLLAFASSLIDFFICKKLHQARWKKSLTAIAIANNLLILFSVKIAYFYDWVSDESYSIVPIGISFYSLQSISYIVDVYKKNSKPATHFADYLSYILFFPQLIAGPIERADKLMPQLDNIRIAKIPDILFAMQLFSFGAFLKLVVANRLAKTAYQVSEAQTLDLIYLLNGIVATLFVYSDFFAYTLMARGLAKLLSVELHINFDRPFAKPGIREFWASWHITLTRWIVDYFYKPVSAAYAHITTVRILMPIASMILISLWHGVTFNFLFFGTFVGCVILCLHLIDPLFKGKKILFKNTFERILMYSVMMFMGNIFLHLDIAQLQAMLVNAHLWQFHPENVAHYANRTFLIGVFFLTPLLFREFVSPTSFTSFKGYKISSITTLFFFILTIIFGVSGGDHVYFEF